MLWTSVVVFYVAVLGTTAGCGGGDSTTSAVVANVGSTKITKAEVNHWMGTLAGGDFYEVAHAHTIPAGLVSEPANYAACVTRLEAAAASAKTAKAPTSAELLSKCRQLNRALKQQAIAYLVEADWIIALAAEEGVTARDQEIKQLYGRIKAEEFPTESKLKQFLSAHRRTLADELFVVKLDVLREKLSHKLTAGGKPTLIKLTEDGQRWTAKTSCSQGYVAPHCKQFTGASTTGSLPSPAVLLEQVAAITGVQCVNRLACA
jgi:hypothetical protein